MINGSVDLEKKGEKENRFRVEIANDAARLEECYRLRYEIFANELGAKIHGPSRLDKDRFDRYCKHLVVIDNQSDNIVATTRLLSDADTSCTGGFYSASEFDVNDVIKLPGRFMEVGRTCVHKDFRKGGVLALLWQGIARTVSMYNVDYLVGCASIPLSAGDQYINSLMHVLRSKYFSTEAQRVRPLIPLRTSETPVIENVIMPPLLKGYIRQGALICGEPYLDAEFGVADVFVLLDCENIAQRYVRHFMAKKA